MTLQATRDLLKDERIPAVAAHVAVHDGESKHWELSDEGQMLVSVVTNNHGVEIWAILRGGGFDGHGVWSIPAVGTEVVLGFDNGEFEGDVWVVGVHGKPPSGFDDTKTLVIDDAVEIRSVNGAAQVLATKADVDALANFVQTMTMPVSGATAGPTAGVVPTATGTQVLKAE